MTLMLHLLGQLMVELQQHPVDLVEDVRLRREGNTDIAVGECGRTRTTPERTTAT